MEIDEILCIIKNRLLIYDYITIEIVDSKKSNSKYIKINGKFLIRISDHYSRKDHICKFNIGSHIKTFHTLKGSYYYRSDRLNSMIRKLMKYIDDNKKEYKSIKQIVK